MIYRADREDNGEEVKGWLCKSFHGYYIAPHAANLEQEEDRYYIGIFYEIRPETLAMDTTIKDKNDKPIFGSILVDGKMSEGGDMIAEGVVGQIIWGDRAVVKERATGRVVISSHFTNVAQLKKGKVMLLENMSGHGKKGDYEELNLTFYDGFYQWPKDIEIIPKSKPPSEQGKG